MKKKAKRKYGKQSQKTVKSAMHKFKSGKLKSGGSGKKVKSRKQAIAIGLSEARQKGQKVPNTGKRRKSAKSSRRRTAKTARRQSHGA